MLNDKIKKNQLKMTLKMILINPNLLAILATRIMSLGSPNRKQIEKKL